GFFQHYNILQDLLNRGCTMMTRPAVGFVAF
ncbi:MAG: hypothetical protein ACI9HA_003119, partial [Dinoroseobacter sp.]